VVNINNKRLMT